MSKVLDNIAVSRGLETIVKPLTTVGTRLEQFIEKVDAETGRLQEEINVLETQKKVKLKEKTLATRIKTKIDDFFE